VFGVTLQRLALSRATLDRAAHRRTDLGLVERLLTEPGTAVLILDGDRAPVRDVPGDPLLALLGPDEAAALRDRAEAVTVAFLGEDAAHRPHVLVAYPSRPAPDPATASSGAAPTPGTVAGGGPSPAGTRPGWTTSKGTVPLDPSGPGQVPIPAPDGARWADLRAVGHLLGDTDAGLLTCAVALANWHAVHPSCARCGADTRPIQAGWARSCPVCGAEHYPRTDPAVIMAIVDPDDRILLGRQARWPDKRFSTLAGFVEPGESLEAAVRREVLEEAAVVVGDVSYRGSQPWPFPSSLMLGFRGEALTTRITVDGDELAQARWWSREDIGLDIATGELLLPPAVSIARRLIEDWYGGPISDTSDWG
jgi:NAD+ diphosphatase